MTALWNLPSIMPMESEEHDNLYFLYLLESAIERWIQEIDHHCPWKKLSSKWFKMTFWSPIVGAHLYNCLRGHVTNPKQVTKTCQVKVFVGHKFRGKKSPKCWGIWASSMNMNAYRSKADMGWINKLVRSIGWKFWTYHDAFWKELFEQKFHRLREKISPSDSGKWRSTKWRHFSLTLDEFGDSPRIFIHKSVRNHFLVYKKRQVFIDISTCPSPTVLTGMKFRPQLWALSEGSIRWHSHIIWPIYT